MATITAAAGGGNWTVGSTWVGGIAPTAADDALLTSASGNVTIDAGAVCRSLNCTTYTGTLTHTAGVTLTIGDGTAGLANVALLLVSGMTYTKGNNATSAISFISTSATVQTIDTGGKTLGNITFNATSNGSWQLSAAMTVHATATVTLTKGTFNTNGQTCSWGFFTSANSNVRTLTLGASAITLTGGAGAHWDIATSTNLTFNSGTSLITISFTSTPTLNFNTLTYYDVTINFPGGIGTNYGTGSPIFRNLTLNANGNYCFFTPPSGSNYTVTGTFTANGTSNVNRLNIYAQTIGSAFTITAAAVSLQNADFRDVTGAGAATWSGTSLGDMLGNTNITFTTPRTLYRVGAGGNWTSTAWSLTSGGSTGQAFPLPQDTVYIDANASGTIAPGSLTTESPLGKDIDFTGFSGTWNGGIGNLTIYGSLIMSSGMTVGSSQSIRFGGRGSHTITSNGKQLTGAVSTISVGGTYTLQDDFSCSNTLTHNNGTFSANNKNLNLNSFNCSNTNTRTLNMGSGTWTMTGNAATIFNISNTTNLTINPSTSIVDCTYSGSTGTRTISMNSSGPLISINTIKFSAGSDAVTLSGLSCIDFNSTGYSGAMTFGTNFIGGNLTLSATQTVVTASSVLTLNPSSGTKSINTNGVQINKPITVNTTGGTVQLAANLDMSGASSRAFTITAGSFDANGFNITCGNFDSSNSNARTITMGSGTWTLTSTGTVWTTATATNLTLNANTSVIKINDASSSSKTFSGGGKTYSTLWLTGAGTGTFIIVGSNTFATFLVDTPPHTVNFTNGTTQTISTAGGWQVKGTAGNLMTLQSTSAGNAWTVSVASGTVNSNYLSLKDSTATGGATFYAGPNSTNVSGNTGWIFTAAPFNIVKSGQYTVKITPSAITKSGQYTVKIPVSLTKSGQYAVRTNTAITKSGQYAVTAKPSVSKSGQYTVKITPSAIQVSGRYAIDSTVGIQKSGRYHMKIFVKKNPVILPTKADHIVIPTNQNRIIL